MKIRNVLFFWCFSYFVVYYPAVNMWLMMLLLLNQGLIHFCYRKNVSSSRFKSNCGVHIHVLQRKTH